MIYNYRARDTPNFPPTYVVGTVRITCREGSAAMYKMSMRYQYGRVKNSFLATSGAFTAFDGAKV